MKDMNIMEDDFQLLYDQFINACDAQEEIRKWDIAKYGEMEGFFAGDLMSVITYLTAADGLFHQQEAEYINRLFGFQYTPDELQTIYDDCGLRINAVVQDGIQEGIEILKTMNKDLALHYKRLLLQACRIIADSDHFVTSEEDEVIQKIESIDV